MYILQNNNLLHVNVEQKNDFSQGDCVFFIFTETNAFMPMKFEYNFIQNDKLVYAHW